MNKSLNGFVTEVFQMDAMKLLVKLPSESIDAVIADPMYGVGSPHSKGVGSGKPPSY